MDWEERKGYAVADLAGETLCFLPSFFCSSRGSPGETVCQIGMNLRFSTAPDFPCTACEPASVLAYWEISGKPHE